MGLWVHATPINNLVKIYNQGLAAGSSKRTDHHVGYGVYLAQGDIYDLWEWINIEEPAFIIVEIDDSKLIADEDNFLAPYTTDFDYDFEHLYDIIPETDYETMQKQLVSHIDDNNIKPRQSHKSLNTARYPGSIPPNQIKAVITPDEEGELDIIYPKDQNVNPDILSMLM
jgi:hypothetical protein